MRKNGFTLLELMVVIAVVGILSSIAIVSYKSSIRKAYIDTSALQVQSALKFMVSNNKKSVVGENSLKYIINGNNLETHTNLSCNDTVPTIERIGSKNYETELIVGCTGCTECGVSVNNWISGCIDFKNTIGSPLPEGCVTVRSKGNNSSYKIAIVKKAGDVRVLMYSNSPGNTNWVEQ